MAYKHIIAVRDGRVGRLTLNRPEALNALNTALMQELADAVAAFDADPEVGAMLLAGDARAFAAGADIREMQGVTSVEAYLGDLYAAIDRVAAARKPVIAAVAGHCLGGGCELAMAADIILAADGARFGQPEITLGIIPGLGGTQRLPRLVGKGRATELILTGRIIDAAEAERIGLATRVVPAADLEAEALALAQRIAAQPLAAVLMAKESIGRAFEASLAEGVRFERRLFMSLFATADQKEGMAAFLEKRPPRFTHR